jgi:hypothetical protein
LGASNPPPIATHVRISGHVAGAAAHHALDGLELRDVGELELRLDAVRREAADVLLDPLGARPGIVISRYARYIPGSAIDVPARSASHICSTMFIWFVLIAIVHLVRRRLELREHVARVVESHFAASPSPPARTRSSRPTWRIISARPHAAARAAR